MCLNADGYDVSSGRCFVRDGVVLWQVSPIVERVPVTETTVDFSKLRL